MKIRAAFLFDSFGPYHFARLKAASSVFELLAVEFGVSSAEYSWQRGNAEGFQCVAINDAGKSVEMGIADFSKRMGNIFLCFNPDVVFIPGWGSREALCALHVCLQNEIPAIMMSDSTYWDEQRTPIKEWIKKLILSACSSAFVAGAPHKDYLNRLGFPSDRISLGYDVVDNEFFETEVGKFRVLKKNDREKLGLPGNYFLASARFVKKKNLFKLFEAYATYREKYMRCNAPNNLKKDAIDVLDPWDLLLLGDGHLRGELELMRSQLGLETCIHMPGFKQYRDLPVYYAFAGAFIHASTTEQWGLVVNEAMASGLPVLVSNRCGCVPNLVEDGINGWTFDPTDDDQLAFLMAEIMLDPFKRNKMCDKSVEIIANWSIERFKHGAKSAAERALSNPKRQNNKFIKYIITILAHSY